MRLRKIAFAVLLGSASALPAVSAAQAQTSAARQSEYNIPAGDLATGLRAFARQSQVEVMFNAADLRGYRTAGVRGKRSAEDALRQLLAGSRAELVRDPSGAFLVKAAGNAPITPAAQPRTSAAEPAADADREIIVTAQKREEKITDVPIAMTALSSEALDDRKIEGGSELLRAIPNVNFSKSNFSMYNFSIRGVGTKAISASSDPAVAVSFNNTPLVRNRLFESEFFDMQRVEVLRGPQGTLYGRNATAGVVNLIPALPTNDLGAALKLEAGNYGTMRANGMLNVPLSDTLGIRVAGAMTKRDGFDYNTFTGRRVNDRDLWSTRVSAQWEPSDRFRANVIWQHFEEDDNRSRTGKQLCHNDPGPEKVGNVAVTNPVLRGKLSQGCLPGSLYDDNAYGVPNGDSLVYLGLPASISIGRKAPAPGSVLPGATVYITNIANPFAGLTQTRNLREISTSYDPVFRAKNDVLQLNIEYNPIDNLTLVSQSAYARDRFFSTQDYNRFATGAIFNDSTQPLVDALRRPIDTTTYPGPTPGGVYCDPQLGCSDRMVSADLSRSRNRQYSQEFRLQSSFNGPVNFNIGVNYIDFKSQDDYYVFNNMFTLIAEWFYNRNGNLNGLLPCELGFEGRECVYVDPNPIESLNNQGHNYFLSQNGVRIKSYAAFGEIYWNLSESLKLTLGARYTRDKKVSDQIPSQLLLGGGTETAIPGDITGGRVNSGYPALDDIHQNWNKFTGRAVLDWKPQIGFTDDTLIYLSASRGYKGGGTNPPRVDFNPAVVQYQFLPQTFRPEFVNAFEIGTKNSFNGGKFTLNANAFYYDYKDYQISQIVDRIAYNENFNATSWGLEFEAAWRPLRAFRVDGNLGFLKTRLKKGAQSIDVMNRTQDDPDWVVVRPWVQVPSNCIAPRAIVEKILAGGVSQSIALATLCPGSNRMGAWNPAAPSKGLPYYTLYGISYDPFAPYNPDTVGLSIANGGSGAPNGGRGFFADLTGNELPNAPRLTANIGTQYKFFVDDGNWELTFRGDYYHQSKSYARIYNTKYDTLKDWGNLNISITLDRPESELTFQIYVKNVLNDSPVTDFFTNSDDTGLTSNVFTLDPRIIGFNVSKRF
ncbi:MAG: TonB-dependent receptor [Sphingopyxis granuli]|uniref:TonB-dependent receptor domain-containing protein n=1 Tax=Sphingopyxis granuli TaxID=267128 RepID=UPI003C788F45